MRPSGFTRDGCLSDAKILHFFFTNFAFELLLYLPTLNEKSNYILKTFPILPAFINNKFQLQKQNLYSRLHLHGRCRRSRAVSRNLPPPQV